MRPSLSRIFQEALFDWLLPKHKRLKPRRWLLKNPKFKNLISAPDPKGLCRCSLLFPSLLIVFLLRVHFRYCHGFYLDCTILSVFFFAKLAKPLSLGFKLFFLRSPETFAAAASAVFFDVFCFGRAERVTCPRRPLRSNVVSEF